MQLSIEFLVDTPNQGTSSCSCEGKFVYELTATPDKDRDKTENDLWDNIFGEELPLLCTWSETLWSDNGLCCSVCDAI